jgi:hypothetical protein
VAPYQVSPRLASARTTRCLTTAVGTTADFRHVGHWQAVLGCFFDERDVKRGGRVCLIGQTVCASCSPAGSTPSAGRSASTTRPSR